MVPQKLGLQYGFSELYHALENHTHSLHRAVTVVLLGLPSLSPQTLRENPQFVVSLGIWKSLPKGFDEMTQSPRYFLGRKVLLKTGNSNDLEPPASSMPADEEETTKIGEITEVWDKSVTCKLDPSDNFGKEIFIEVNKKDIVRLNNPQEFYWDNSDKMCLEDGIRCDYRNKLVKAKLVEICFNLSAFVTELDFSSDCQEQQQEAVRMVRSCLNLTTFQRGVDRSRLARTDCVGKLAVNGQGHCHGVSSTMAAFLLPLCPLLGLDLKYRSCYTFQPGMATVNNTVDRHHCLELSLRPSGRSGVCDLWMEEKHNNPDWLFMDIKIAYNRLGRSYHQNMF